MRYQGRIADWKDDKGFGFVTPNGGGERAFVHIHAFKRRSRRPVDGDLITFEVGLDERKRPRAIKVHFAGEEDLSPRREDLAGRSGANSTGTRVGLAAFTVIAFAIIGILGYEAYRGRLAKLEPRPPSNQGPSEASTFTGQTGIGEKPSSYKCDGRTHCSQMTSCAEASYYLKNCPAVEMDGDGDGVACESQWCN